MFAARRPTACAPAGPDLKGISTVLGHSTITLNANAHAQRDAARMGDVAQMLLKRCSEVATEVLSDPLSGSRLSP